MSGFDSLFSGMNFQGTIQKYCNQIGWKISDINSEIAVLKFDMQSGRTQTMLISRNENMLSFLVVSMFKFDSEDQVPNYLSTILMKRNAQIMIGKWGINVSNSAHIYSVGHSVDMQLMNADFFRRVVTILITECDDLETYLLKMINQ